MPEFADSLSDLRLAGDMTTSPETLVRLAAEPNARLKWRVARNPNTPLEALLRLWTDDPTAMVDNSATTLHWLANPAGIWKRVPLILQARVYLHCILHRPPGGRPTWLDREFTERVATWGKTNRQPQVAIAMAHEPEPHARALVFSFGLATLLPGEELLRLARDPHDDIRLELAALERLPKEAVELLACDPVLEVRLRLARRRELVTAIDYLLTDPDPSVRAAIYQNPRVKLKFPEALMTMESPENRRVLACHSNLDTDMQRKLAATRDSDVLAGLLWNTRLDPALRGELTPLVSEEILVEMLDYRLPTEKEWKRHRDLWPEAFRRKLTGFAKVPHAILLELASDNALAVRRALAERLQNPKFKLDSEPNRELLSVLAQDSDSEIRRLVEEDPRLGISSR